MFILEKLVLSKQYPSILLGTAILLGLSACAVGPDFHSPNVPQDSSYLKEGVPKGTLVANGSGQNFWVGNLPMITVR